jgi:putative oxidoreductase
MESTAVNPPAGRRKHLDAALLVLRLGIGVMFIGHGWPKLTAGPEVWAKVGGAMGTFGIEFAPAFWGFLAALTETLGGALLMLGLLARPAAALLLIVMFVAAGMHISKGDPFNVYSHAVEAGITFLFLLIAGGGDWAVGRHVPGLRKTWAR